MKAPVLCVGTEVVESTMRSWKSSKYKFWQFGNLPQAALVSGTQLMMGWCGRKYWWDNWHYKTRADTQTLPQTFPRNLQIIVTLPSSTYLVAAEAGLTVAIVLGISLPAGDRESPHRKPEVCNGVYCWSKNIYLLTWGTSARCAKLQCSLKTCRGRSIRWKFLMTKGNHLVQTKSLSVLVTG